MSGRAEEAADLLDRLWRENRTIDALPPELAPAGFEEALAIQAAFARRHASCGWKVGPGPGGRGWTAAPLRGAALASPGRIAALPPPRLEVEVGLVLAADLPAGSTEAAAEAAIGGFHLALELFGSRYADPARVDAAAIAADNFNNAGVLLGGGVGAEAAPDLAGLGIRLFRDDVPVGQSDGGNGLAALLPALCWLADYAAQRSKPLAAGDIVITGARIGPLPLDPGATYRAECRLGTAVLHVAAGS
mgnify:CR=1 FL=1